MIREPRAFTAEIDAALDRLDTSRLEREYWAQDEFLFIPQFLPETAVGALLDDLRRLEPGLNRNYIPRHKKGGSVSRFAISDDGPALLTFYRSERFRRFLGQLVRADLKLCPDEDPHTCALYFYTEAGEITWGVTTTPRTTRARATPCCSVSRRTPRAASCAASTRASRAARPWIWRWPRSPARW
jgi:hypothetical protein